jgi:uncharacterized protein
MKIYVDTSAWIAALCSEAQSEAVATWLGAQTASQLYASEWVKTEIASALSIKFRRGELQSSDLPELRRSFADIYAAGSTWAALESLDFSQAATLCSEPNSGLRGGDALQLATALRLKCSHFFSLDHVLNKNAVAHGLTLISL